MLQEFLCWECVFCHFQNQILTVSHFIYKHTLIQGHQIHSMTVFILVINPLAADFLHHFSKNYIIILSIWNSGDSYYSEVIKILRSTPITMAVRSFLLFPWRISNYKANVEKIKIFGSEQCLLLYQQNLHWLKNFLISYLFIHIILYSYNFKSLPESDPIHLKQISLFLFLIHPPIESPHHIHRSCLFIWTVSCLLFLEWIDFHLPHTVSFQRSYSRFPYLWTLVIDSEADIPYISDNLMIPLMINTTILLILIISSRINKNINTCKNRSYLFRNNLPLLTDSLGLNLGQEICPRISAQVSMPSD